MALPNVNIDLDWEARRQRMWRRTFAHTFDGGRPAFFMEKFHEMASKICHSRGAEFVALFKGDEQALTDVAGRMKYMMADLKILRACADVAATTDGRCIEVGLDCMATLKTHLEVLEKLSNAMKSAAA